MAQNTNRAWSDSARDGGYASRDFFESSEFILPSDPLPEFRSAFRERDGQARQSQGFYQESSLPRTSQSSVSRPYAAAVNRDYAARDAARVSSNPYGALPRQRNSFGYRETIRSGHTGSQSAAPRIHAEAFQPMGSHSVAGQKRRANAVPAGKEASRRGYEYDDPRNYRKSADFSNQPKQSLRQEFSDERFDEKAFSEPKNVATSSKAQKREDRRRRRRHEQADKKFNRQFSGEVNSNSDAGPRAAVIKAEMGSKQRKAMRAQQVGLPQLPFLGGAFATVLATIGTAIMTVVYGFTRWRTLKKTVCFVAIIALICASVYTPAQQYYRTIRLNDQLEAEYKAIEERNEALGLDLATLGTREGVEARAHEQFGLVEKGEESANVLGLDYTYDHSTTMMAAIPSGSVETPDTAWYTPLLDAIFGVE